MKNWYLKFAAVAIGIVGVIVNHILYNRYFGNPPTDYSLIFIIFFPYLLLALIGLFLRKEVFKAWFVFSCVWLPINALLFFLITRGSGGGFSSVGEGMGATYLLGILGVYAFISIAIFIFGSLRKRTI